MSAKTPRPGGDCTAEQVTRPGALLTRVSGRATPRAQALKEFERAVAELRHRYKPVFWPLLLPEAEDQYRWRIQLECGCIRETYTHGKDAYPDEQSQIDPITRCRLPKGQYWCSSDHAVEKPYREIVEWVSKEVKTFPPDPDEPKYGIDPETWAIMRRVEPTTSAIWQVRLACDHYDCHVITAADWKPEDGPRIVSVERRDEMLRDFEECWATDEGQTCWPQEGTKRDHVRRMLDLRWPRPKPEQECHACTRAQKLTGYQRIGWLVPRPNLAPPPPTEREQIEAQLAEAEAEVRRLRHKLEDEPTN